MDGGRRQSLRAPATSGEARLPSTKLPPESESLSPRAATARLASAPPETDRRGRRAACHRVRIMTNGGEWTTREATRPRLSLPPTSVVLPCPRLGPSPIEGPSSTSPQGQSTVSVLRIPPSFRTRHVYSYPRECTLVGVGFHSLMRGVGGHGPHESARMMRRRRV